MIEIVREDTCGAGLQGPRRTYFCNTCAHEWTVPLRPVGRFASIEQVVQRTGLRRDELTTLADIGALNAFTHERRSALWQVERAVRPAGELYAGDDNSQLPTSNSQGVHDRPTGSPLPPMDDHERLRADYGGM